MGIIENLVPRLEQDVKVIEDFVDFIKDSESVEFYRVFDVNGEGVIVNLNNPYIYVINQLGKVKCIEQDRVMNTEILGSIKSIRRDELFNLVQSIKYKAFWSENFTKMSKNEILIYCMAKYFSESVPLGETNGYNYYLEYDQKNDLYYVVVRATDDSKMMDAEYCPILISRRVKVLADSKIRV